MTWSLLELKEKSDQLDLNLSLKRRCEMNSGLDSFFPEIFSHFHFPINPASQYCFMAFLSNSWLNQRLLLFWNRWTAPDFLYSNCYQLFIRNAWFLLLQIKKFFSRNRSCFLIVEHLEGFTMRPQNSCCFHAGRHQTTLSPTLLHCFFQHKFREGPKSKN